MTPAKIAFPGFTAPAAGFEAPLEMLSACHGRVERQCQTLLRLVPHLAANGPDQTAREAALNVMRYFDTSARHHHADEEEDLFPALLQAAPPAELAGLRGLVAALQAQHRELEQAWAELRPKLDGIALGTVRELGADEAGRLVGLYRSHIEREEAELLPLAARILGTARLDGVGRSMRARRGIDEI
jgi:hemerythrin-like domain-containing protein